MARGSNKKCVVLHATPYDGALEKACKTMNIPVHAFSTDDVVHAYCVRRLYNDFLKDVASELKDN